MNAINTLGGTGLWDEEDGFYYDLLKANGGQTRLKTRSMVGLLPMIAAGFRNVRNLEGSIFAWANEGRPLVNARGQAAGVLPFNIPWGRYLEKSLWRWKPEP